MTEFEGNVSIFGFFVGGSSLATSSAVCVKHDSNSSAVCARPHSGI